MTGLLLQIGATKLAVSGVLAAAVWIVHRRVDRPAVSYPLWLMVLLTLVVPAIASLPVLPAEPMAALVAPGSGAVGIVLAEVAADPAPGPKFGAFLQPGLAILWLGGTVGLLGWTAVRAIRFRRTLKRVRPAPSWLRGGRGGRPGSWALPDPRTVHHERPRDAHGVVEWGEGPDAHPVLPSARPWRGRTPRHPGPRAGSCPPPRPPGALVGMAGLLRLLVEPGDVVGPPPPSDRRGVVL